MKNHLTLLLIIIISCLSNVIAQGCIPAGITFTSQKQIDNFTTNFPGCTQINGDLRIEENVINNITNLNGLSQIISIEGDLIVTSNSALITLKGLNNLTTIKGQLGIWRNASLENIGDLDHLKTITGNLTITKNASLVNLNGLNNLTSIEGLLRVKENNLLTNLNGLNNVTHIGKDLWVGNNKNMKSLSGLENVKSIKGSLLISLNKSLMNIDGLKNLASIEGSIKIWENASLANLNGLDNVTSIKGYTNIYDNASLANQKELEKLSPVTEQKLVKVEVKNNIKEVVKKAAYGDSKWEFGAEVGFASVKLKKRNSGGFKLFGSKTLKVRQNNKNGFRVMASAKYNINGQLHFIGGFGFIQANGSGVKRTVDIRSGIFAPTVTTTTNESVDQKYTIIEIPAYLRWHLFGEHRSVSDNFNIFIDGGFSYKLPIKNESSFAKSQSITTTITDYNIFNSEPPTSSTTATSSYDEGELELQSKLTGYFAFGFLIGNRTSLAFTTTGINTQGKQTKSIKHKSNLNSVAVTVFF